jgi:hypothetical protein
MKKKSQRHRRAGRTRRVGRSLATLACGLSIGVGGAGAAGKATSRPGGKNTSAGAPVRLSRAAWPRLAGVMPAPRVLDLALAAASCAINAGLVETPKTLTVIDYSRPSTERRLWVLDLATGDTLFHELVAHGSGSGEAVASSFSNDPDSHQSSLGLFRTADTYVGRNGYSLRLDGLEKGFNDRARERALVVHGAAYVSDAVAKAQGRIGRSWGCPALGEDVARQVIDSIKGGDLVYAYYPDSAWLNGSPLLGSCDVPPVRSARAAAHADE